MGEGEAGQGISGTAEPWSSQGICKKWGVYYSPWLSSGADSCMGVDGYRPVNSKGGRVGKAKGDCSQRCVGQVLLVPGGPLVAPAVLNIILLANKVQSAEWLSWRQLTKLLKQNINEPSL